MKDKLTKKRIKVDYEAMIIYLKLDAAFVRYIFEKNSKISSRRTALAFLRSKKINIESVYFDMKEKGFSIDQDNSDFWSPLPGKPYKFDDEECKSLDCENCQSLGCVDNTPDFFRGY